MSLLQIEPMQESDSIEIANVMMQAFNYVNQGWTKVTSQQYIAEAFKSSLTLIARLNNRIVGFLVGDKKVDDLCIDAIGVHPDFMGQGIAKSLWIEAEDYAKKEQLNHIKMTADPTSVAYEWYMRLGFKDTGWVEVMKDV